MRDWSLGKITHGEGEDDEFRYRECYEFNTTLAADQDDERCEHCAKFLTLNCKHIDEFINEEEE
jgi:hypothetical protein